MEEIKLANEFNLKRVLQALYYIYDHSPYKGKPVPISYLLQMLYFADRHHLRHYGTTISGDRYAIIPKFEELLEKSHD